MSSAGLRTRDFDRVYRRPDRRRRSQRFLLVVRRRDQGASRWGLTVQARLGNAVLRNRIKRRLRELLRRASLPAGWDIVVQPRSPDVATADFAALGRELDALLEKTLGAEDAR
jgi:ribonuclease P protein component